jgi:hypothetical protein
MKEWAIIDFRHESKRVNRLHDYFWYVLYTDDYTHVTIQRCGHDDTILTLRGDMVDGQSGWLELQSSQSADAEGLEKDRDKVVETVDVLERSC